MLPYTQGIPTICADVTVCMFCDKLCEAGYGASSGWASYAVAELELTMFNELDTVNTRETQSRWSRLKFFGQTPAIGFVLREHSEAVGFKDQGDDRCRDNTPGVSSVTR